MMFRQPAVSMHDRVFAAVRATTVAIGLLGFAGAVTAQTPVTFTDIGLETGFQDRLSHGRALVTADFNGDGWDDFYVGNPGNVAFPDDSFIFLGNGPDGEGQFTFSKNQVLLTGENAFTGSAVDFDNDGDPDLFIGVGGQEGIGRDYLFRNDGGIFTDVSDTAGVRGPPSPGGPVPTATSSGTWADYDNDGDLDLFVASRIVRFSVPPTLPLPDGLGQRDSLFRNNGNGTFTDVTDQAGVGGTNSSMTAAWGDFDLDGWMDLFVPHYEPAGFHLYRNNQDGTFTDVAPDPLDVEFGTRAAWASAVADFDRDGMLDIISFARNDLVAEDDSHALLMNQGAWEFSNEAVSSGLAGPGIPVAWTMGTQVGDFNNDGLPDLFVGNGGPTFGDKDGLARNITPPGGKVRFENASNLIDFPAPPDPGCIPPPAPFSGQVDTFVDDKNMLPGSAVQIDSVDTGAISMEGDPCNPTYPYRGHGTVFVDFDKDGDLDLAMVKGGTAIIAPTISSTEPNRFFRNDGGNANNWLFVDLQGVVSNRDGYGARIEVISREDDGSPRSTVQQVQGNTNFSATGPHEVHFGLGADNLIDEVRVFWPSGIVTVLAGPAVNQQINVREDVLLSSDFDVGTAPGWTFLSGNWLPAAGGLGQNGSGRAFAVNDTSALSDYIVVGKLCFVEGAGQMTLAGRSNPDGTSHYGVALGGSSAQLYKMIDGAVTFMGDPLSIEAMTPGRCYITRLEFAGSAITMSVDGQAAPTVSDPTLASGHIGVGAMNTSAMFDNIAVYQSN